MALSGSWEHGLGFMAWDADVPGDGLPPLRYQDRPIEDGHELVGAVFLCRGNDDWPKVAVASFPPTMFGPPGSVHWHDAIEFTITAFEGKPYGRRSNAGLPVLLNVDGHDLSARAIATQYSQVVISSNPDIAVAVIYADGEAQPRLVTANWRTWHNVSDPAKKMPR